MWLAECDYGRRNERRILLPNEFESVRVGSCAEHATWAWRKLYELGFEPELVVGDTGNYDSVGSVLMNHSWIRLEWEGDTFVYDTSTKPEPRLLSETEARTHGYRPYFSVDTKLRTWLYPGFVTARDEGVDQVRDYF